MKSLINILIVVILTGCVMPQTGMYENPVIANYRAQYLRDNPGLSPEMRNAIQQRRILHGMSRESVMAAWGPPATCSRTYGDPTDSVVCLYYDTVRIVTGIAPTTSHREYKSVYFVDGKVVDWQLH